LPAECPGESAGHNESECQQSSARHRDMMTLSAIRRNDVNARKPIRFVT
jgi:hypothetical protein